MKKLIKALQGKPVTTVIRGDYIYKTVNFEGKEIVVGAKLVINPPQGVVKHQLETA